MNIGLHEPLKSKIYKAIQAGQLAEAIQPLQSATGWNEIATILEGKLNRIQEKQRKKLLTREAFEVEYHKLVVALINILSGQSGPESILTLSVENNSGFEYQLGSEVRDEKLLGQRASSVKYDYRPDFYLERNQVDKKLQRFITNGFKTIILLGKPLAGKTRAVLNLLHKIYPQSLVFLPHREYDLKFPASILDAYATDIKPPYFFIFDDVSSFVDHKSFISLFRMIQARPGCVMLCTSQLSYLYDIQTPLGRHWSDMAEIRIPAMTTNERIRMASIIEQSEQRDIDDTIGSFFIDLREMKTRYQALSPTIRARLSDYERRNKLIQREILRSYKCVEIVRRRNRGVKQIIREYVLKRFVERYQIDAIGLDDWDTAVRSLEEFGFITKDEERYYIESAYVDRIIAANETETQLLEEIIRFYPSTKTYTKLIWRVSSEEMSHYDIFKRMLNAKVQPNETTFNGMVKRASSLAEVQGYLEQMREYRYKPTSYTLHCLISDDDALMSALDKFELLQQYGIEHDEYSPDKLLRFADTIEELKFVVPQLERMQIPISGPGINNYINKAHNFDDAWQKYNILKGTGFKPDEITFFGLIAKAQKFNEGYMLFQEIVEFEIEPNSQFFESIFARQGGDLESAQKIYEYMIQLGLVPSSYVLRRLIDRTGDYNQAYEMYRTALDAGMVLAPTVYNRLIQLAPDYNIAQKVFDEMGQHNVTPSRFTYNTLMHKRGCRFNDTWRLFEEMVAVGLKPDVATAFNLIKKSKTSDKAWEMFGLMKTAGIPSHFNVYNILIQKSKSFSQAWKAYEMMLVDEIEPLGKTMILLAQHGDFIDIQQVINEIKIKKIKISPPSTHRSIFHYFIKSSESLNETKVVFQLMRDHEIKPTERTFDVFWELYQYNEGAIDLLEDEIENIHYLPINNYTLYVANLDKNVTHDDLRALFSRYGGVVEVKLVRRKNEAFIEMGLLEDAEEARYHLNYSQLLGRVIKVREAKPRRRS